MEAKTKEVIIFPCDVVNQKIIILQAFSAHITANGELLIDTLDDDVLVTHMFAAGQWRECIMKNQLSPEYIAKTIEAADIADGQTLKKMYEKVQKN